jgi:hypothetical protein
MSMHLIVLNLMIRLGLVVSLSLFTLNIYADEFVYKPAEKYVGKTLNHGEKWQTDAPLRLGMDNIHTLMTAKQNNVLKESLKSSEYFMLSQAVDKNIAYITKNCKLTIDSDRAFHTVVLADMIEGVALMRSSGDVQVQRLGALGILQTLRNYGKYFEHPNWSLVEANAQ